MGGERRARFLDLFTALRIHFDHEDSCKFGRGRILTDRCLVSFAWSAICGRDGDLAKVESILRELAAPPLCSAWVARHCAGAGVVHFGFESDGDARVHKIYLEYVRDARQALVTPGGPQAPVLVHRALKWRVGMDQVGETHYRLSPHEGLTLDERLVQQSGDDDDRRLAIGMARDILRQALTRAKPDDIVLLDVTDIDSARRSFDLQLYDARIRLADVEARVTRFGQEFGVPMASLTDFFAGKASLALGHIACGQDAAGSVFATLYYGARTQ